MKKSLYEEFKKAEKLGANYVKNLYWAIFDEAKKDNDLERINELFDVANERKFFTSKEMQKVYDSILPSFMRD